MSWTPKKVSTLKELWGKGNTAAQIASIIGGVTRNAVIGKAYRLNLAVKSIPKNNNFKQVSQHRENVPQPERKTRKSRFESLLLDKNFEPENPKSLEELHDEICLINLLFCSSVGKHIRRAVCNRKNSPLTFFHKNKNEVHQDDR